MSSLEWRGRDNMGRRGKMDGEGKNGEEKKNCETVRDLRSKFGGRRIKMIEKG